MLGLGEGSPTDSNGERKIGWGLAIVAGQTDAVDVSSFLHVSSSLSDALMQRETLLLPYLRGLSSFRDSVRRLAINGAYPQELLALSDQFRDFDCVDLGIALDDQEGLSILLEFVALY